MKFSVVKTNVLIVTFLALVNGCNAEPPDRTLSNSTELTHISSESSTISDLKKIQIINKIVLTNNFLDLDEKLILASFIENLRAAGLDAELVDTVPPSNRVFQVEHSNRRIGTLSAVYFRFRLKHVEILPIERDERILYCACDTWMVEQGGTTAIDQMAEMLPSAISSVGQSLVEELNAGKTAPEIELKRRQE